ncbi:MAG: hypothetical protein GC192_00760 [Bacteroidetes bacterium]|nr:hypothetical protein [Bacteroidota bacterium]
MKLKILIQISIYLVSSLINLQAQDAYIVKSAGLNIRSLPSGKSELKGELSQGDTIISKTYKGNWIGFKWKEDSVVYVSKTYLEPIVIERQIAFSNSIETDKLSFANLFEISWIYFVYILGVMALVSLIRHYLL